MLRTIEYLLIIIAVAGIIIISYWVGQEAYHWMPIQATTDAERIDNLFSFLVWMSSIIFLCVVGMIAYSILTCRADPGDYREGHPSRGNLKIEAIWTGIPILLVLWISGYGFYIYDQMDIAGPQQVLAEFHLPWRTKPAYAETVPADSEPTVEIEVMSQQWNWSFHYPQQNVTSTELHLPVNQRVRLVLQSKDVLHGFYIPEFRIKQDIIPNRPIDFQFIPTREGHYQLQDSQFSGTYFALMQADVYVDSLENYHQWLAQIASREPTLANNRAVSEYETPPQRLFQSHWHTTLPTPPPVVNYAS